MSGPKQLAQRLRQLAVDLYVAMELRRIVRPARHREEAIRRLCLHAREYYERFGGLPVHIIFYHNGNKQVMEPEETPAEFVERAIYLLEYATNEVWWRRGEWRCRPTLSTLEHACDECYILHDRDYSVVVTSCTYRRTTHYGVSETFCVYDFGVSVHFLM
jgi:hypothetical protein